MKYQRSVLGLLILFVCVGAAYGQNVSQSTLADQTALEVTVYNNNLALVKDTRTLLLPRGQGELRFMDVASYIMPVTVHAKSLNAPESFMVLEQNYEYDLMNANKLLDKFVDKKVKLVRWDTFDDRKEKEEIEAVLLSNNSGQIYKVGNEIYLGYPGHVVLPEIPQNLIAKPTLMWMYQNNSDAAHELEVSYLTTNISWKADYVFVLNKDDTLAGLNGWVTLDNKSGATYQDAKLKLIAGEVNRVQPELRAKRTLMAEPEDLGAAPQFAEKAFFEYHIYDLQRKTTIKDNQTKQISLLEANGVTVAKDLLVYGEQHYYTGRYSGQAIKKPVNVYIKFKNAKENNLGMPLPAGVMRLYKADDQGSLQFIGEDKIDHTPKDEEIRLKIGEAFDVVAERIQTDYQVIGSRVYETEWEVTLRNHKDDTVTVGIIEPVPGDWTVVYSSHPYKKMDAFTIRFDVPVAKDQEVKIKYKVRVRWG